MQFIILVHNTYENMNEPHASIWVTSQDVSIPKPKGLEWVSIRCSALQAQHAPCAQPEWRPLGNKTEDSSGDNDMNQPELLL